MVQLLFPTFLQQLVYEKEKRLRMMMKMHGLGDGAYWLITYCWYFLLYLLYIAVFLIFGNAVGLKYFRKTNGGLQFIFLLFHGLCMIGFAFMLSSLFTSALTAVVFAYLYVFASGLIGSLLLQVRSFSCWQELQQRFPVHEFNTAAVLPVGVYQTPWLGKWWCLRETEVAAQNMTAKGTNVDSLMWFLSLSYAACRAVHHSSYGGTELPVRPPPLIPPPCLAPAIASDVHGTQRAVGVLRGVDPRLVAVPWAVRDGRLRLPGRIHQPTRHAV